MTDIPEGKKKDMELMVRSMDEFNIEARKKFLSGIEEHNSDGTRGMNKMSLKQKVKAIKEEAIDLWFYACSLEEDL